MFLLMIGVFSGVKEILNNRFVGDIERVRYMKCYYGVSKYW